MRMELYYLIIACLQFAASIESNDPKFSSQMQNTTVVAGREARMSCFVENLNAFKVAWVHYGESGSAVLTVGTHVLTTNKRVSVESERDAWTLIITNTSIKDRGNYMCQISTVPPKKRYAILNVQVPPHIFRLPSDVTVDEGQSVQLDCEATGDPEPQITWRREDGSKIYINGTTVDSVKGVLYLEDVTKDDSGAYLCVASNGVPPAVSARAQVAVNYAPFLESRIKDTTWALVGQSAKLICHYHSYPMPNVTWTQLQNPYRKLTPTLEVLDFGEGRSILYFQEVENADFGAYKCVVENVINRVSAIRKLEEIVITTMVSTSNNFFVSTKDTPTTSVHPPSSADMKRLQPTSEMQDTQEIINFFDESAENTIVHSRKGDTNSPNRFIQDSLRDHHDYPTHFAENSSAKYPRYNEEVIFLLIIALNLYEC